LGAVSFFVFCFFQGTAKAASIPEWRFRLATLAAHFRPRFEVANQRMLDVSGQCQGLCQEAIHLNGREAVFLSYYLMPASPNLNMPGAFVPPHANKAGLQ
jgi:hypothetical protein